MTGIRALLSHSGSIMLMKMTYCQDRNWPQKFWIYFWDQPHCPAIPFSRGSSWPRDQTWVSHIIGRLFPVWATREAPASTKWTCLTFTISRLPRIDMKRFHIVHMYTSFSRLRIWASMQKERYLFTSQSVWALITFYSLWHIIIVVLCSLLFYLFYSCTRLSFFPSHS